MSSDRLLAAFLIAIIALVVGLWVSLACTPVARAYVLYGGSRWPHPPTHTADPMLTKAFVEWAKVSGFQDGGVSDTPEITISYADLGDSLGGYATFSQTDGYITNGVIVINTHYKEVLLFYVHELGHVMGIAHSCEQGQRGCELFWRQAVMAWDGGLSALNIDDIAAARALYGMPPEAPPPVLPAWRVRLAMVSR